MNTGNQLKLIRLFAGDRSSSVRCFVDVPGLYGYSSRVILVLDGLPDAASMLYFKHDATQPCEPRGRFDRRHPASDNARKISCLRRSWLGHHDLAVGAG